MKKYACNGCGGHCTLTTMLEYKPNMCFRPEEDWHEVEETVTNCNQLPKLTEEVFNRLDCPEWANYAAVDKDGGLYFYGNEPSLETSAGEWCYYHGDDKWGRFDDNFDASDWQNSLVERSKEELPEWCQAAKWIYFIDINKYTKILSIDNLNKLYADYKQGYIVPARKRSFNDKEMKALVGKKLESPYWVDLILSFSERRKAIETKYGFCDSKVLMDSEYTIDGKPCYVLEHQNDKGEWVE